MLIYCFLRDGTENEAVVSQEVKNRAEGLLSSVTFIY